jgi:hypothetical protein
MNKVHFVSDKLMVHNDKEVTIYQIGADHSIKPFARLINPLNLISNVVLRDDSILVNEIPFARRYAFGETAEVRLRRRRPLACRDGCIQEAVFHVEYPEQSRSG